MSRRSSPAPPPPAVPTRDVEEEEDDAAFPMKPQRSDYITNVSFVKLTDIGDQATWRKQGLEQWLVSHDEMKIVLEYLPGYSVTVLARCSKTMYERFLLSNEVWQYVIERDLINFKVKVEPNVVFPNPFHVPPGTTNPFQFIGSSFFRFQDLLEYDEFHEQWCPFDSSFESFTFTPVTDVIGWRMASLMWTKQELEGIREPEKKKALGKFVDEMAIETRDRWGLPFEGGSYPKRQPMPYGEDGYSPGAFYLVFRCVTRFFGNPYEASLHELQLPGSFLAFLTYDEDSTSRISDVLLAVKVDKSHRIRPVARLGDHLPPPYYTARSYTQATVEADHCLRAVRNRDKALVHLGTAISLPAVGAAAEFLNVGDSPNKVLSLLLDWFPPQPFSSAILPAIQDSLPRLFFKKSVVDSISGSSSSSGTTNSTSSEVCVDGRKIIGVAVTGLMGGIAAQHILSKYFTLASDQWGPSERFSRFCLSFSDLLLKGFILAPIQIGLMRALCPPHLRSLAYAVNIAAYISIYNVWRLKLWNTRLMTSLSYRYMHCGISIVTAFSAELAFGPAGAGGAILALVAQSYYTKPKLLE